jgi:hypothetical protein
MTAEKVPLVNCNFFLQYDAFFKSKIASILGKNVGKHCLHACRFSSDYIKQVKAKKSSFIQVI